MTTTSPPDQDRPIELLPIGPTFSPAPVSGAEARHLDELRGPTWSFDLKAAVVVFLVALPLCLGIALASGAPLFSGITAGVVGGIVVGAISGSALMVSGPAAGLTAIVISAIATLGSYARFLPAVVVGGIVQIALGLLGAGVVAYYFPSAVIRGMLAAIGLILILKQLPHAVGYDADFEGDETFRQANDENTFSALTHAFDRIEPTAAVLAALALLMLVAWDRKWVGPLRVIPGPLAVVLMGIAANVALAASAPDLALKASHLVQLPIVGSLGDFAALFTRPDWSVLQSADAWRVAVTIGIVASLESLLSLEATDRMDPYRREAPANRELLAQGAGNVVSGLLGGLPVTGVIVRSAANVEAGAKTKRSAMLHGVLLAIAVLAIPGALNQIPLAVLAAILLYTGYKLAHPSVWRRAAATGAFQLVPFVVTVLAILLTDLLVGIGIGLAVGFVFILAEHMRAPCFTVVS
ncbi:MAG: SulP family inorganic anion transporter, partial [Gemmatimonadaceae bacterium]|nr:SulP family inorganic anion transporter [Gemmatimonadaceae bacterium]